MERRSRFCPGRSVRRPPSTTPRVASPSAWKSLVWPNRRKRMRSPSSVTSIAAIRRRAGCSGPEFGSLTMQFFNRYSAPILAAVLLAGGLSLVLRRGGKMRHWLILGGATVALGSAWWVFRPVARPATSGGRPAVAAGTPIALLPRLADCQPPGPSAGRSWWRQRDKCRTSDARNYAATGAVQRPRQWRFVRRRYSAPVPATSARLARPDRSPWPAATATWPGSR